MLRDFKKLISLLDAKQRRKAIVLIGLIFIEMILEAVGIGLVVPILAIVSQANEIGYLKILDNETHSMAIIVVVSVFVLFYCIKTPFIVYLAWKKPKFAFEVGIQLSQRLFECYLNQPYVFHLQRNTAQLVNNITNEVSKVVKYGLICIVNLVAESAVFFSIVLLMLYFEPIATLIVASLMSIFFCVYQQKIRYRIYLWGEKHLYYDGKRFQYAQQGLGGVKDAKLLGREQDFLDQYEIHNVEFARVSRLQEMMDAIPRLWLEWFTVIAMAVLVFVILIRGNSPTELIPVLGFFAAAAFRIMPSVSRILTSAQGFFYASPAISCLCSEMELFKNMENLNKNDEKKELKNEIVIQNLYFTYNLSSQPVFKNICFHIKKGWSVGLVGSSGSGKTTLVEVILGLLKPSKGKILLDGQDIQTCLRGWQNLIGYVPQSIYFTDDTFRRNIAFGIKDKLINNLAVERAAHLAQLDELVSKSPHGLDTFIGERGVRLSGGQRQRIGIARALYHDPEVLIFDEATSALDIETENEVIESLKKLYGKKTILIVAHRLNTVQHCDVIKRIENGCFVGDVC